MHHFSGCEDQRQKTDRARQHKQEPEVALSLILLPDQEQPKQSKDKERVAEPLEQCPATCRIVTRTGDDPVAFFSLILGYVVWLQFIWLTRQERVLSKSVAAAETSANAALDVASTTRDQFIAAHRARLVVRQISIIEDNHGATYGIQYYVYNVGDTRARIKKVSEKVWLPAKEERVRVAPSYGTSKILDKTIKSGHWLQALHVPPLEINNELALILGAAAVRPEMAGNLFFLGFIQYEDEGGTTRNVSFLRQYDFTTKRFNPTNDPDYEYQD
jgi:hypothetical protein